MATLDRTARQIFFWEFIQAFILATRYLFKPKTTINYPFEKGPLSALSGRTCTSPLSQRRGTLHRLQIVRGNLSGAGDHD